MNELEPKESGGEFLLYQAEDGQVKLEVCLQNETVWLTQQMIAERSRLRSPISVCTFGISMRKEN